MAGPLDPHGPLDRMGRWDDPELADIFRDDPELYELSRTLRASRPDPELGTHFEPYLRARLMDAAELQLRPRRGLWGALRPRPGLFAGGAALVGAAMIAAVVVTTVMFHPNDLTTFRVSANVAENHQVSPDDVIRVSFNQAVDRSAVEHNLQIRPATAVSTSWDGTTLVITPLHHLAANTPYTVTIPKAAVHDDSGHRASTDVRITFGTAATPTPGPTTAPAAPPTLQPAPLGSVSGGSGLVIAPDGSIVATQGLPVPVPGASPSPSAGGPATPTSAGLGIVLLHTPKPGHGLLNGTPTPGTNQASPTPEPSPLLFQLDGSAGPRALGPAATAAAFSPSGRSLAYLVPGTSTASLVVARPDGTHPITLVHSAAPSSPLAWSGEDGLLYLSGAGQLMSVDLQGRRRPVGGLSVAAGQDLVLVPGGHVVYVGAPPSSGPASPSPSPSASATASATPSPQSVGHLLDLSTGNLIVLQGIQRSPSFSGDGSTVAWVDESGAAPVLDVMATGDGASPTTVSTAAAAGDSIDNLALSGDGSRLVYTLVHDGATPALRVVSLPGGDAVAVGDGQPVAAPVLSQNGDRIAFLGSAPDGSILAEAALIPGSTPATPAADAIPAGASTVVDRFVAAQIGSDVATLRSLAASGFSVDASLTPTGVTRYYVIKASLDTTTGSALAHIRLVRDATLTTANTSFADETLKLVPPADGQPFQVTAASLSAFQTEPSGPQVLHVATERQQSALVVRISFDSDLDASTVTSSAISLLGAGGAALPAGVSYQVESRTVVVRLLDVPAGQLTLNVGGTLSDIAGQIFAGGYTTTVQG